MKLVLIMILGLGLITPAWANTYCAPGGVYGYEEDESGYHDKHRFKLTDGGIADMVWTANDGEIGLGHMAIDKARSEDVKDFARMMVKDHKHNSKKLEAIVDEEKISLEDSRLVDMVRKHGDMMMDELAELKGLEFDHAYIETQVIMLQHVLAKLDHKFIPNVKNARLREFLEKTRADVAYHLKRAEMILVTFVPHN